MKGKLYKVLVRPAIIYGLKTVALLKERKINETAYIF